MIEIWKDIKGYEGIYKVSNFGRVKSIDRIGSYRNRKVKGCIRKLEGKDYLYVSLWNNNICKLVFIHRLVAEYFVSNPNNKPIPHHKDLNTHNNHYTNLDWLTHSEHIKLHWKLGSYDACKDNILIGLSNGPIVRRKPVICVETGGRYVSRIDAERDLNLASGDVSQSVIYNVSVKGYTFVEDSGI